jgi:hypothetical protein
MEQLVPFFVVFALGFGVGYSVRDWKSRVRRRRYSRTDQAYKNIAATTKART